MLTSSHVGGMKNKHYPLIAWTSRIISIIILSLTIYFANYSDETLAQIANGYETMQRWLFRPDYDATQRAVIGDIEGRLLISQAISNIALEGIMTPETAAEWLQEQVELLLAERQE